MPRLRFAFWLTAVAMATAILGCEKPRPYTPVHLVSVRGRVLTDGQPVSGAIIRFHPRNPTADSLTPAAKSAEDGSFELTTYENNDGAPPGEYDVTLRLDEAVGKHGEQADRFRGRYADPKKSAWHVRIEDRPIELDPFVVK